MVNPKEKRSRVSNDNGSCMWKKWVFQKEKMGHKKKGKQKKKL